MRQNRQIIATATTTGCGFMTEVVHKASSSRLRLLPAAATTELLVLLAVNPASSATAERSFSSLRRLKTWLRSTMSQQRLNSCAVCNTHRSTLDAVDIKTIRDELISRNDFRQRLFGRDVCDKWSAIKTLASKAVATTTMHMTAVASLLSEREDNFGV